MEKEFYSINELATMTGFTTRSLRNFIQMGHLDGEKIDGIWQFSSDQVEAFLKNPNVAPGIKTKNNSVIFDFIADSKKQENQMCCILDLNLTVEEAKECSEYFCNACNKIQQGSFNFKFQKTDSNTRIIVSGPEDFVRDVINGWYEK